MARDVPAEGVQALPEDHPVPGLNVEETDHALEGLGVWNDVKVLQLLVRVQPTHGLSNYI